MKMDLFNYLNHKPMTGASAGFGGWFIYTILKAFGFHDLFFKAISETSAVLGLIVVSITAFFSLRKLFFRKKWDKE